MSTAQSDAHTHVKDVISFFENALMPCENQQVLRLRLSNSINENKNNSKNCWISSLVIGVTANKHVDFFC